MTERDIFVGALQIADPAERANFLDAACADDSLQRARIERLLKFHEQAGEFLDFPATVGLPAGQLPDGPLPTGVAGGPGATWIGAESGVQAGSLIAGRYKLLQQIGEGGMGSVWMAEQVAPVKRQVAFKVIKEDLDSQRVLARFEAERQALALMDHPHIARILDAGTTAAGRPFFVMDLVKGLPITEFCDSHQLPIAERLALFIQVCRAVQHAHQKGVIHRDLKPSNILVESHDGKPVPKVIDFGLAKALHQLPLTERTLFTGFGAVVGTPLYMSPEQAEFSALDVDTRADIYSLGVILYELLTGSTPLQKQRVAQAAWDEIRRVIKEEEPPRPSMRLSTLDALPSVAAQRQMEPARLARLVRGDLDWIVMRALSKERDRRYPTANAFAEDVSHFLDDQPVSAGPPTVGYRLQKFVKRNRGRVVAGLSLLAVLAVGMAGTIVGLIRARNAEQQIGTAFEGLKTEQGKTRDALNAAEKNRLEAEVQRDEVRRRLSRQYVEKGVALADAGNPLGGLPWLVEALKLDEAGEAGGRRQRMRIGALLQGAPRLVNFWPDAACATLHPDGRQIAVGSGQAVRLVAVGTDQLSFPALHHGGDVSEILFLPGGNRLAVICNRAGAGPENPTTARIWDATTGQPLTREVRIGNGEKGATAVRLSPNGTVLCAIWQGHLNRNNVNTEIFLYDTATLKPVGVPFVTGHEEDFDRVSIDLVHLRALTLTRNTPPGSLEFASEAQVWDLQTGAALFEPIPVSPWILDGRFNPEGTHFVLAKANDPVSLYDAVDGKKLVSLPHPQGATKVAFSSDGKLLATLGIDRRIRVWDAATGSERLNTDPWPGTTEGAYGIAFTPDGASLHLRGSFGLVTRDAITGELQLVVPGDSRDGFRSAESSPDGIHVATAGFSGLRLWQGPAGRAVCFLPHGDAVESRFTGDGRFLMATGNGVRIWDLALKPSVGSFARPRDFPMRDMTLGSSGHLVACLDDEGRIQARDARTGTALGPPHRIPGEWRGIGVSPDGKHLLTWGWPPGEATIPAPDEIAGRQATVPPLYDNPVWESVRTLQVWDAATGRPVAAPMRHRVVERCLFHPDGKTLIVAGSYYDKTGLDPEAIGYGDCITEVSVWDLENGKRRAQVRHFPQRLEIVSFSHDGRKLLVKVGGRHDDDRVVAQVWDGRTLEPAGPGLGPIGDSVIQAVLQPDGSQVLTVSQKGEAQIWDAAAGAPLGAAIRHVSTRVGGLEAIGMADFSPDGRWVVTATGRDYSSAGEARVWDVVSGRPVTSLLRHAKWVRNAAFSPDQTLVATIAAADPGWEVRIWEVATGLPVIPPVPIAANWAVGPPPQPYERPQFTSDGARLLIPTYDGVLTLDIEREDRPAEHLEQLAKILAGNEIDGAGGYQPVSETTVAAAWDRWKTDQPDGRRPNGADAWQDGRERLLATALAEHWWKPTRRLAETLLNETPDAAWLWRAQAEATQNVKDWEQAESAWAEALRRESSSGAAFHRGEALAEQGKFVEAAQSLSAAWKASGRIEQGIALAWAQWGAANRDGYLKTCAELRARHAEYAGNQRHLSAVALVESVPDEARTTPDLLISHLERLRPFVFLSDRFRPALAMEYLRSDRPQEAVALLTSRAPSFGIDDQLVLALALARTQKFAEARQQLTVWRERYRDNSQHFDWQQRLMLQTLLREVESKLPDDAP